MQLTRIKFEGYKRLAKTQCSVDGRTIAFIGPNEAGKSSVLQGLQWLTQEPGVPLRPADLNRSMSAVGTEPVVQADFRLDASDIAALHELDISPATPISLRTVKILRVSRTADGTFTPAVLIPLRRSQVPFEKASSAINDATSALQEYADSLGEDLYSSFVTIFASIIDEFGISEWTDDRITLLAELEDRFGDLTTGIVADRFEGAKNLREQLEQTLKAIQAAHAAAIQPEPEPAVLDHLVSRMPRFLLFSDEDRILKPVYNLADDELRLKPPTPFANLLSVAQTSPEQVWEVVRAADNARMRTLESRMNAALSARLQPMWTQSSLTLSVAINQGGLIEVNIVELANPDSTVTPIDERSDGLRAFLALICFLVAADLRNPPILLVDEAERNLHYDAQSDLVRVLTHDLKVAKVLYTTHSPGCLPLDLGTGIRVVHRNPSDPSVSSLENNFWTDSEPGFSRLLFVMGAEVAAFSALRRAVLAEGVSEMILLPTLLRNASDGAELDFQVAFGLSNMSAATALGSVALITTFLVDGDEAGDNKLRLLREEGVPDSHLLQLPRGQAIEDLVDRKTYLDEVDGWLEDMGAGRLDRSALAADETIAHAVDRYCKEALGLTTGASHKIIAFRLAERGPDLKLNPGAKRTLVELRESIELALRKSYTLEPSASLTS